MANVTVFVVRALLVAISLGMALLAAVVWRRRSFAPEARAGAALLLAVALYVFGYAGEVAQTDLPSAQRWLAVEYLGIPWIPSLWLLVVRKRWGLRPYTPLLLLISALVFLGHVTDPWLHLYNRSTGFVYRAPFWIVNTDRGAIAWLNIGYLCTALLWGVWIWASKLRGSQDLFQKQGVLVLVGTLSPFLAYLLYLAGWSPYGLDMCPLAMSISSLLWGFSIFGLRCFELMPLAREHVFHCIRDGVLVLDMQKRLIDFNPAARELFAGLGEHRLGEDVFAILPEATSLGPVFSGQSAPQRIELPLGGAKQHFELRAFPLKSKARQLGWALILANVTAQVRLVHKLRRYAETDPLTGVSNRRRFFAALEEECVRSGSYQEPFSVLILDLDHFKDINDHYGHPAGDRVLCRASERIAQCLRGADLLSRYGGEEFAVLLPLTGEAGAMAVAERIRQNIAEAPVEYEGESIPVTASIGVTSCHEEDNADPELILQNADRALYRAKREGRNRVVLWEEVLHAKGTGAGAQ